MARAEKIVVELSPRDRKLFKDVLLKLAIIADKNEDRIVQVATPKVSADHPGLKRLTEPAGDSYVFTGEGDWQLQNEQKVGEDD